MHIPDEARRRAFSTWLRTGRLTVANDIEVKFNPWHDPDNGRFTFTGSGRYYGPGQRRSAEGQGRKAPGVEYIDDFSKKPLASIEEAKAWRAEELAKNGHKPGYREAIEKRYQQYLSQFAPRPDKPPKPVRRDPPRSHPPARAQENARGENGFTGGGGDFGGGGVTGSWEARPAQATPPAREINAAHVSRQLSEQRSEKAGSDRWRQVWRNGYLYEIDRDGRTRRVSGELTENPNQKRSKTSQSEAGGSDRRPTDEGGHYIARRFNGPTEAFNHFAQDRDFNHDDYASLENQWARAKRLGKRVRVKIAPVYEGRSQRPSALNVWFWINGKRESYKFPNESRGKSMQDDRTSELLGLIGHLLAEDTEYPLENTLLYARLARARVAPSIFKDRGNKVLYRDPDLDRLGDALLDLWYEQQGEERWAEIEYIVRNGRFDATFVYPDEIDLEEDPFDRRDRVVAKYFGDKPIIYPAPDEEDQVFKL